MTQFQTWEHSRRKQFFLTNGHLFKSNRQMIDEGLSNEFTPPINYCEHCKAELVTWSFGWEDEQVWRPAPERCSCEAAKAYWAEYDSIRRKAQMAKDREARLTAQREQIDKLMSRSGLETRYPGATFETWITDTPERDKALRNARWYVDNFAQMEKEGKGLYISGDSERGKTHLAAGIAFELVQQTIPVIMTSFSDLLSRIRATFRAGHETEATLLAVMESVDLLVIDDLGKETPTEWALERLFAIVDNRVTTKRPIIITTNYTNEELYNRMAGNDGYGERRNDPKMVKAIIARLQRACMPMTAKWQRWTT